MLNLISSLALNGRVNKYSNLKSSGPMITNSTLFKRLRRNNTLKADRELLDLVWRNDWNLISENTIKHWAQTNYIYKDQTIKFPSWVYSIVYAADIVYWDNLPSDDQLPNHRGEFIPQKFWNDFLIWRDISSEDDISTACKTSALDETYPLGCVLKFAKGYIFKSSSNRQIKLSDYAVTASNNIEGLKQATQNYKVNIQTMYYDVDQDKNSQILLNTVPPDDFRQNSVGLTLGSLYVARNLWNAGTLHQNIDGHYLTAVLHPFAEYTQIYPTSTFWSDENPKYWIQLNHVSNYDSDCSCGIGTNDVCVNGKIRFTQSFKAKITDDQTRADVAEMEKWQRRTWNEAYGLEFQQLDDYSEQTTLQFPSDWHKSNQEQYVKQYAQQKLPFTEETDYKTWAQSIVHAAEFNYYAETGTLPTFSVDDFYQAIRNWYWGLDENHMCKMNFDTEYYEPECVAMFAKNTGYVFRSTDGKQIKLTDYEMIPSEDNTFERQIAATKKYRTLLSHINWNKNKDIDRELLHYNEISKPSEEQTFKVNSVCFIVGTLFAHSDLIGNDVQQDGYYMSAVIHPYSRVGGKSPETVDSEMTYTLPNDPKFAVPLVQSAIYNHAGYNKNNLDNINGKIKFRDFAKEELANKDNTDKTDYVRQAEYLEKWQRKLWNYNPCGLTFTVMEDYVNPGQGTEPEQPGQGTEPEQPTAEGSSENLLLTEAKKAMIQYPKQSAYGSVPESDIPSWVASMIYAAEINYLHINNQFVKFNRADFLTAYQTWAQQQTGTCAWNGFNENVDLSCVMNFAKNNKYAFKSLDGTKQLVLREFNKITVSNIFNVQSALQAYPVLYTNINYDASNDASTSQIDHANGNSAIVGDFTSACVIVGIYDIPSGNSQYTYNTEFIHPWATYNPNSEPETGRTHYMFQTVFTTMADVGYGIGLIGSGQSQIDLRIRRLYDNCYGLTFTAYTTADEPSQEQPAQQPDTPAVEPQIQPQTTPNTNDNIVAQSPSTSENISNNKSNIGAIVGGVVGGLAGAAIIVVLSVLFCKKRMVANAGNNNNNIVSV